MTQAAARRRELLKPPEIKPVLTVLLMFCCCFFVGEPSKGWAYNTWCAEHAFTAQKFFSLLEKSDYFSLIWLSFRATAAQLGPFTLLLNSLFWWLFSTVVEKKLLAWRFPAFLFIGLLGSWAILAYEVGSINPSQRFIGPSMYFMYLLGAYLIYKPKKPFKPADWKPLPWKIFKGDEESKERKLKVPFVSPWVYITLFALYTAFMHCLCSMSVQQLQEITHLPSAFVTNLRALFLGSISAGTLELIRPVPAAAALFLGLSSAYVLSNIVFRSKLRRDAGDLQVQAILQYKELRALDMNHKQAVEATAKLIGVPLDIVKDWIAKGLQSPPRDD